jgi:hypothetical protein
MSRLSNPYCSVSMSAGITEQKLKILTLKFLSLTLKDLF